MKSSEKKTILLVEDQAIIAMSEASMLKKNGYEVIISNTGEQAIITVEENPTINLILMDIDLGKGIDGTEAAQRILKFCEVPVVFLSNHTEKEIVEKTEKITSYGYVVKNSGETVLIASIKMAFKLFEARNLLLKNEQQLLESEKKFNTLEKQIDDVIWTMDMNFRFTYISPSVEKMHGFNVDEMMMLNPQDYLTPESAQQAIEILGEQISDFISKRTEGNIVTINIDQIKKDGTIFPTEIKARFLVDDEKNPIGIIGVTRDITERLKTEEALFESKRTLDLALEGAQVGFWDSNYVTGKVYRSEIWASMLGYTLDEVENTSEFWRNHIHPDDFSHVIEEVVKHEEGKSDNFSVEHRIRTKSGEYKWILDWGKVFERSDEGRPIRAMGVHIDIDKRVRIEKDLIETNKTLNLALEGAQIGLWDQDFVSGKVKRTEYWAKMLGYDLEDISETLDTWKSLLHPDDYDGVMNAAKEHEQGLTENFKVQHRLKCKDDSYRWILNWGRISERDENGKPIRAVGIHLDIDDRVKTEEALVESERRLRNSLEATSDGIWEVFTPTKEIYCSPTYYTMLGYKPYEIPLDFNNWDKISHPDDLEKIGKTFEETLINGLSFSIEHRLKTKSGDYNWVLSRGKVVEKDKNGIALKISGSSSDINERKKIEEELRLNENKLKSIFQASPVGIGVTSNRILLEVNDLICKMTGYCCEELIGKSARIFYSTDEEYEFVGKEKYNQIEKSGIGTVETKWKRKDEKIIDVLLSSTPLNLKDISGGVTFIALDITERKHIEGLIKESEANLNSLVNNRNESIWSIDTNYNFIFANDYFKLDFLRIFNVELKKGMNVFGSLTSEQKDFWKPIYEKALTGTNLIFEFSNQFNNETKFYEVSLSPIISDGKIIGTSALSVDITKKKKSEEEILQRKEELERFEKIVVGRELKMIELKEKTIELENKLFELKKMDNNFSHLRKFLVPEFVFGEDALYLAAKYVKRFQASKVFLVTDKGLAKAGWLKELEDNLKSENINYVLFDDVTPNPKDTEVMKGAEILRREKCDIVVALGGGSPMDCAKAISITFTNNVPVSEFEGIDEVKIPGLPLICIPTTAGTSADISQFAIINDSKDQRKFAIISKLIVPDVALIDTRTTTTMSPELTAETGMDALVHAIEAYVSNASSPITDINALKAIELIITNLPAAYNELNNMIYRNNMMMASLLAGFAFSNASLGLVHAMAHSLGGSLDFAHGECNALLLESVINFNFDSAPEKYFDIARLFEPKLSSKDLKSANDVLKVKIRTLKNSIGLNYTLKDIGVKKSHIKTLAEKAIMDGCLATNPKLVDLKSIEECYNNAL